MLDLKNGEQTISFLSSMYSYSNTSVISAVTWPILAHDASNSKRAVESIHTHVCIEADALVHRCRCTCDSRQIGTGDGRWRN